MTSRFETELLKKQRLLQEAVYQRDEFNRQIIQLQADIRNLTALHLQDVVLQEQQSLIGLTEAIRSVVRLAQRQVTAAEITERLRIIGFDFSSFNNPSAAVHNTLKRLGKQGELIYFPQTKTYAPMALFWPQK